VWNFEAGHFPPGWAGLGALGRAEADSFGETGARPSPSTDAWRCTGPRSTAAAGGASPSRSCWRRAHPRWSARRRAAGHLQHRDDRQHAVALGTDEQREGFLPRGHLGRAPVVPGLHRTRGRLRSPELAVSARLEGDEWVIDGTKTWTSLADSANRTFVLARSGPASSASWAHVPALRAGSARRRRAPCAEHDDDLLANSMTLDRAHTRVANMLGNVGDGWRVALTLLGFQRGELGPSSARGRCPERGLQRAGARR
jgi:alkylation response protein AidB-like acyl-CoA dehydrogenase